jgi:tetratricopeptide (TPR) repeat protein
MLRYIVPTLLVLAFLTVPAATELDRWQHNECTENYRGWPRQNPDCAYPSLRMKLAQLDQATLQQSNWSLFGQPRTYGYLQKTTSVQRVDFAVSYLQFIINQQYRYFARHSDLESGLGLYRSYEIPYERCRTFAISWWSKNSDLYDRKRLPAKGHFREVDDRFVQEALLDAGELLYRAHVAGVPSVLCNDSQAFSTPPKYLPFLEGGFFTHQQIIIDSGSDAPGFIQELKERALLTADSLIAGAQQTAEALKNCCADKNPVVPQAPAYSLINRQGQIAAPINAPAVANFQNGIARIGLRLEAPIGAREKNQYGKFHHAWTGSHLLSDHKFGASKTSYDFGAIVDTAGNWHYDVADYHDPNPEPGTDSYNPASSVQSEYYYNRQAESHELVYPSDSRIRPVLSENGYVGYGYDDATPVILPRFDWAGKFHQGLALVLQNGKFGYIDLKGKYVIPPTFEAAGSFSQGVAPALDSVSHKWGYIDETGHFVIAPRFQSAYPFFAGLAVVGIAADEVLPQASPVNQSSLDLVYGRAALEDKQAEVARQYLQKAIADDPHGPFAKQARLYLKTRVPAKTVPFDAEVELRVATADYSVERTHLLKDCVRKYPQFEWAYTALAQNYIDTNSIRSHKAAREVLEQLRKFNPEYLPALLLMAEIDRRNGDTALAKAHLQAAKALNPEDDLVRQALSSRGASSSR